MRAASAATRTTGRRPPGTGTSTATCSSSASRTWTRPSPRTRPTSPRSSACPVSVLDEGFLDAWLESRSRRARGPRRRRPSAGRSTAATSSPGSSRRARSARGLLAKAPGLAGARASFRKPSGPGRRTIASSSPSRSRTANGASSRSSPKMPGDRRRFKELLAGLRDVVDRYDLHRGWFGTGTLLHSVTCHPGHPLEVIGQGLSQGNDWFTFSGYMDFLMLKQLPEWLQKVGLDIAVDVGTGKATPQPGHGRLRPQELRRAQDPGHADRGGVDQASSRTAAATSSGPSTPPTATSSRYDGQIAIDGNKKQIDTEDVPFILQTGLIKDEPPACMVLFAEKGRRWTREEMWKAILDRRAVGVLPLGRMMGPAPLPERPPDCSCSTASTWRTSSPTGSGSKPVVEGLRTPGPRGQPRQRPFDGTLEVRPAPGASSVGQASAEITLPPGTERCFSFRPRPAVRGHGQGQSHPRRAALEGRPQADPGRARPAAGRLRPQAPLRPGARRSSIPFPSITSRRPSPIRSRSRSSPRTGRRRPSWRRP